MKLKTAKSFGLFLACMLFSGIHAIPQSTVDSINTWVESQLNSTSDTLKVFNNAHLSLTLSSKDNYESGLIKAHINLARFHEQYGHLDSAIYYFSALKDIYKNNGMMEAVAETCLELKVQYGGKAAYAESMEQLYEALEIYEALENRKGVALCYTHICDLLYYEDKYRESADYCNKAIAIQEQIGAKEDLAISLRYKAASQLFIDGALEEALETINKAIDVYHEIDETGMPLLASINGRGNILKYMEHYDEAVADYQYIYDRVIEMGLEGYAIPPIANIGHVYLMQEKYAMALPYFLKAIELMKKTGSTKNLWENYSHVAECYKNLGDYKKAFEYRVLEADERERYLNSIIDRLESEAQIKYETTKKDEMISLQENTIAYQQRTQILYISIAVLLIVSLIGMLRSRVKIRKKQKEIERSKEELQLSLENLKATQAQLIHAEKMASLGELTAGIAHEIQNPLNFVKNFSEVNAELIEELKEEINEGDAKEAIALANNILENEKKIIHHGKRADGIVKGMLQHSRKSSGEKEATDINVLADEYLRLAYHGLRAKDKSFNADFKTNFDPDLPKISIVPQDIGRVLLNLINNAFYAVSEASAKETASFAKGRLTIGETTDGQYKPLVVVSTKHFDDKVEVRVKDNGYGIPDAIKDKIFQPFFTTKPTGQGTGLGLSLSYDIVKAHGGELNVVIRENEGTEFIIKLPVSLT